MILVDIKKLIPIKTVKILTVIKCYDPKKNKMQKKIIFKSTAVFTAVFKQKKMNMALTSILLYTSSCTHYYDI